MQINNNSVARIIQIIKYVNLEFYDNNVCIHNDSYVPGESLEFFSIDPIFIQDIGNYKKYSLFYDWMHNNTSMPLLVPNVDTIYTSYRCDILVPKGVIDVSILDHNVQHLENDFIIKCDYPLYFNAYTEENQIRKPVIVGSIITVLNNEYNHKLSFEISDINVTPGTPKTYEISLQIYRDKLKTKYLGTISFTFELTNTTGTGE